MAKPALVGLNNPFSPRPSHALVSWPAGCPGHRVLSMIQEVEPDFSEDEYLDAFWRMNLWRGLELPEGRGSMALLQTEGRHLLRTLTEEPRDVVLFGVKVWYCVLNRQPTMTPWFESLDVNGSTFWKLPHPSGLCREYNDESNRRRAGEILLRLARSSAEEVR